MEYIEQRKKGKHILIMVVPSCRMPKERFVLSGDGESWALLLRSIVDSRASFRNAIIRKSKRSFQCFSVIGKNIYDAIKNLMVCVQDKGKAE